MWQIDRMKSDVNNMMDNLKSLVVEKRPAESDHEDDGSDYGEPEV